MTSDDIIRMAREAGFADTQGTVHAAYQLEHFAALVAQHEREACAKVADEWQNAIHDPRYECDCATAIRARGNNA
jgi:hypothetical protein